MTVKITGANGKVGRLYLDSENGYRLTALVESCTFEYEIGQQTILVTDRSMREYHGLFHEMPRDREFQYVDVGAGLGGFIPYLIEDLGVTKRPIVIDPCDYTQMREMLITAKQLVEGTGLQYRIDLLLHRSEIYLDSSRVVLIQEPVRDAVQNHSEIAGIADVVLDHWATGRYCHKDMRDADTQILKTAQREKGLFLIDPRYSNS
ncbi:hypothetical protein HZA99_03640 [Candidatus Woesearchaeota archaeon]|nr:hypothetical protein [Candidatus Woesearchaeota archaeon]